MASLTYEKYNNFSFLVHGDREKYSDKMKKIGGRWNTRVKGEQGWTVPFANEALLKALIERENPPTKPVKERKKSESRKNKADKKEISETKTKKDDEKDDEKDTDDENIEYNSDIDRKSKAILELLDVPIKKSLNKYIEPPVRQTSREKHSPSKLKPESDSDSDTMCRKNVSSTKNRQLRRSRDYVSTSRNIFQPREDERKTTNRRIFDRKDSPQRNEKFTHTDRGRENTRDAEFLEKNNTISRYSDYDKKPVDFRKLQTTMQQSDSDTDSYSTTESGSSSSQRTPVRRMNCEIRQTRESTIDRPLYRR